MRKPTIVFGLFLILLLSAVPTLAQAPPGFGSCDQSRPSDRSGKRDRRNRPGNHY
jgi:hypothetical protein